MTKRISSLGLLLVLGFTFLIYANSLSGQFVWDDFDFIVNWQSLRDFPHNLNELLEGDLPEVHKKAYRPLRSVWYGLAFQVWQLEPMGYHLQSVVIHILATFMVYQISLLLLKDHKAGLLATLIFGIHPVHIEAVSWITASFDTIGSLFFLTSFYWYVRYKSQRVGHYYWLFIGFAGLAFYTYELTLILPGLIVWYELTIERSHIKNFKKHWSETYHLWLLFLSYWLIRFGFLNIVGFHERMFGSFWATLLVMMIAVVKYLSLLIWPYPLTVNHQLRSDVSAFFYLDYNVFSPPQFPGLFDLDILASLLVLIMYGLITWYWYKKRPMLSFCLGWIVICLIPILQVFPRAIIFAEKYLYLSSVMFSILIAFAYLQITNELYKKITTSTIAIIIVGFGFLTWQRNNDWQDSISLWSATLETNPNSPTAYRNLGFAYEQQNDIGTAQGLYQQGLAINTSIPQLHLNLANTFIHQQDYSNALTPLLAVTQLRPNDYQAFLLVAQQYEQLEEFEQALSYYQKALQRNPQLTLAQQKIVELSVGR